MSQLIDEGGPASGEQDGLGELGLDPIDVGEAVEVRRRFDQAWAKGFVIAGLDGDGYRLRRNSDGTVLPVGFPRTELRRTGDA